MTNPIAVRGIDHIVVRAANFETMIAFYRDVLGCQVERGPGEIGLAQLRAGSALIDIVDVGGPIGREGGGAPDPNSRNMDHFCLFIEPWDASAIATHLARFGVKASEVATRYGAQGDGPSIYIRDPEGNGVELKGQPRT